MAIIFFQINSYTSQLGQCEPIRIYCKEYATENDAKNYATFKAKELKNNGYKGDIVSHNTDGKYTFVNKF